VDERVIKNVIRLTDFEDLEWLMVAVSCQCSDKVTDSAKEWALF
jgi:hypothetical protein